VYEKHRRLVDSGFRRRTAVVVGVLLAVAAAINVPLAVFLMGSRTSTPKLKSAPPVRNTTGVGMDWPWVTPHQTPWPAPNYWQESTRFGFRTIHASQVEGQSQVYSMEVEFSGWPLPVIAKVQMWWDWNSPALAGVESEPGPQLVLRGLILNPILFAAVVWAVCLGPFEIFWAVRRAWRIRGRCCAACGYPIGTSEVCTECGVAHSAGDAAPSGPSGPESLE